MRETFERLLERAERAGKADRIAKYEAELATPEMPASLVYVWRMWERLRSRKGSNGFGVLPIEWPDLAAFVQFMRIVLTPFEVEMIELIDNCFLAQSAKDDAEEGEQAE